MVRSLSSEGSARPVPEHSTGPRAWLCLSNKTPLRWALLAWSPPGRAVSPSAQSCSARCTPSPCIVLFLLSGSHKCHSLANLFIPNFTSEICRRTQPATKVLSKFGGGRGNKNPHTLQDQTIWRQKEKVLRSQESHQRTLKVIIVEFF